MTMTPDTRIFRLFYAADDTLQPCVPATATLIPRVAAQHLHTKTDRARFERFVRNAQPGDLFHLTGKKYPRDGIVVVVSTRSQLPRNTNVGHYEAPRNNTGIG